MVLKWVVWFLQAMLVINAGLHAMVLVNPPGPMMAQYSVLAPALRLALAAVYALCALGMVIPEFIERARLTIVASGVLAVTAAVETVIFVTSDRAMAGGSRGLIVALLILFAYLRNRRIAAAQP